MKRSLPRAATGRSVVALLAGGLIGLSLLVPAGGAAAAVGGPAKADDGAAVMKETVVDARTVDLAIWAPSVTWVNVRLLLPKNWSSSPGKLWPALYLLPGPDSKDFEAWTTYTDVKKVTAPDDVLVVMPGAGVSPAYTDEPDEPGKNPAKWETFHTVELPQILQRGYRANGSNAVAGISSGGFGALSYTFRHPDLYQATASYSAPTDLYDPAATLGRLLNRSELKQTLDPWGPPLLGMENRLAHNPQSNLTKFRGHKLYISSGMGLPGPLDESPNYTDPTGGRIIEAASGAMNTRFVAGLRLVGVNPTVHIYPDGLHYWTYWNREFALSYPMLKAAIGGPTTKLVAAPAPAPAKSKGLLDSLFGGLFG